METMMERAGVDRRDLLRGAVISSVASSFIANQSATAAVKTSDTRGAAGSKTTSEAQSGMPADVRIRRISSGGIDWHVEQRGVGADIVLVPSGEGDCAVYDAVAANLSKDFRVTTFDMPGFSRSTVSDKNLISVVALAGQIADLIDKLGIKQAVFYGCSSGGLAVLDIATQYSHIVRRTIVHEAALPDRRENEGPMFEMAKLDDAGIVKACEGLFANMFNENQAAWKALGEDYHRRLAVNYPVWVKQYVVKLSEHKPVDPAALIGKPITWTIGGLFEVRFFFSNVQLAHRAGVALEMLPSKHFPQVSIPDILSDHIRKSALV